MGFGGGGVEEDEDDDEDADDDELAGKPDEFDVDPLVLEVDAARAKVGAM